MSAATNPDPRFSKEMSFQPPPTDHLAEHMPEETNAHAAMVVHRPEVRPWRLARPTADAQRPMSAARAFSATSHPPEPPPFM